MIQLDIVKAFLNDPEIQDKYGLTPDEVNQLTMQSPVNPTAKVLVGLIRRMVLEVEDQTKTANVAAAAINLTLENALR